MSNVISLLSDFKVAKSSKFLFEEGNTEFPSSPTRGQFAFVSGVLYMYTSIRNVETWYPLTNQKKSYIHVQSTSSTQWTVLHNLESTVFIFMVYDTNGDLILANLSDITENSFKLNFTSAISGKVILFVEYDQDFNNNETQSIFNALKDIDGTGSGLDSDLLDGQEGSYYLSWNNFTSKPTTLSGYGITDAQPLDADLTAIAVLTGSTGFLKKTAENTWAIEVIDLNWNNITSKPTTVSGYGITDAYTKTEVDALVSPTLI